MGPGYAKLQAQGHSSLHTQSMLEKSSVSVLESWNILDMQPGLTTQAGSWKQEGVKFIISLG